MNVDIVTTEAGHDVMENLKRKAAQADRMFSSLVANMNDALAVHAARHDPQPVEAPPWLR